MLVGPWLLSLIESSTAELVVVVAVVVVDEVGTENSGTDDDRGLMGGETELVFVVVMIDKAGKGAELDGVSGEILSSLTTIDPV